MPPYRFHAASRPRSRRIIVAALWAGVVLLALIGIAGALGRGIGVVESIRLAGPTPELSRFDSLNIRQIAKLLDVEPGTSKYEEGEAQTRRFVAKYNAHPLATLLHVAPAALFMMLAPFQFSRRLRSRYIRLHRWSGRLVVAIAVPIGLSGLFFGLLMPFSGALEASAIALFGGFFLLAVTRAFIAIKSGEVARHREWMLRMFSVAIGISTVRIVGIVLAVVTREGPESWFAQSVWIGFALTVAAAELWIRSTRRRPVPALEATGIITPVSSTSIGSAKSLSLR